ncbi:MAG TPA: hypothetical protein VHN98_10565 [Acidimicrobiales bacterium]|nr:hypothetical protein [Acidimicrobiales bacterium]
MDDGIGCPGDDGVEVWNTLTRRWTSGFAIDAVVAGAGGVRLRRRSDGAVLRGVVPSERVRPSGRDGHPRVGELRRSG